MKGLAVLVLLFSVAIVSILSMIHGWGLEPKSWGWIIAPMIWMVFVQVISEGLKK